MSTAHPASTPLSLRAADDSDLPAIAELADTAWRSHYRGIISDKQIDYMLEMMYQPWSMRQQIATGHRFVCASYGPLVVAFASFSASLEDLSEGQIHKLYVHPDHQDHGIGVRLIDYLSGSLRALGRRCVTLTVNRRNIKAINFYFKVGFVIRSAVDIDIGEGFKMKDFVMAKTL